MPPRNETPVPPLRQIIQPGPPSHARIQWVEVRGRAFSTRRLL